MQTPSAPPGDRSARRATPGPHPSVVLIRLSIALGATAGFTLGLILLWSIALGQTDNLSWAALVQVHGQVQTLGFVGLFVLGTAAQLLPGFLASPLIHRRPLVSGGALLAIGLLARAAAQPFDPGDVRSTILWLSAVGVAVGVGLCLATYGDLARRSIQPPDPWRTFAMIGFGWLGISVVLNAVAVGSLTAGQSVVSGPLDSALVEVELHGFIVFLAMGVSRKILPRFLLLSPPDDRLVRWGGGTYFAGVVLVTAGWLANSAGSWGSWPRLVGSWGELAGVLLYLVGLNLYRVPTRPSGAPNVTEPARHWLRIAFGWLVFAQALGAFLATREVLGGPPASFFEQTAARHAVAQGFVMIVIVAYAARILPGFSAWAIAHGRWLITLVGLLTAGAALRVAGEWGVGMIGQPAELIAGIGGGLSVIGFAGFAAILSQTLSSGPRQR